jgi:hypothetical protein
MIQRVQSIYLVFASIAISTLFFLPIAVFTDSSADIFHLCFNGIAQFTKNGWLLKEKCLLMDCTIIIALAGSILSIFYFKNRKRQIKICWFLIIFDLLLLLLGFYYEINIVKSHFLISVTSLNWPAVLPIVSIILTYLAIVAIKKDEELVKSMDRIR